MTKHEQRGASDGDDHVSAAGAAAESAPTWTPKGLLADLGTVLGALGADRFLAGPIVMPSDEAFPPFAAGLPWARAVTTRLMAVAGLEARGLDVEPHDGDPRADKRQHPLFEEGPATGERGAGTLVVPAIAWFVGREGDVLRFGLDMRSLGEPAFVIAALARAVAEAVRERQGGRAADPVREAEWIDLTAVALGFGVLLAEAAYGMQGLAGKAAALPWPAFCWLAAAQLTARGKDATREVLAKLPRGEADVVQRAMQEGVDLVPLALPPGDAWPAAPALTPAPQAVARPDEDGRDWAVYFVARDRERAATRHAGLPVFRIAKPESRMRILFAIGALALAAAAMGIFQFGLGVFVALAFGLLVVAVVVGERFERVPPDECSDCPATIPSEAETCPGCGGTVHGRLASRDERLAAREALEAPAGRSADDDEGDGEDEDEDDGGKERA